MDTLTSGKYKTCGYGLPLCNQEGEYDEVKCKKMGELCGINKCPLQERKK